MTNKRIKATTNPRVAAIDFQWLLDQGGFDAAWEAEDGGPLAFAVRLPDDFAVEEGCDFSGGEVAVKVEVFGI